MSVYTFKFDRILKSIIHGLDDEKRFRILEILVNSDKQVTFKQLLKKTGFYEDELEKHLYELSISGLVDRYEKIQNIFNNKSVGYYEVSLLGKKTINSLLNILYVDEKANSNNN